MKAPLVRAARLLTDVRTDRDEVIGRLRGRELRFGLYASGDDDPEEVWAAYAPGETGALDLAAFFGDTSPRALTGDAAFDAQVAICANLPEVAARIFDASLRGAVLAMRCRVDCCQGVRVAKYRYRTPEADLPVEAMIATAADVAARAEGLAAEGSLPRAPTPALRSEMKREKMSSVGWPVACVALLLAVVLGGAAVALR